MVYTPAGLSMQNQRCGGRHFPLPAAGCAVMRRITDRYSATASLFRGSELMRLMTMVIMLCVLWQLISRARSPQTWRWVTGGSSVAEQTDFEPSQAKAPGGP